MARSPHVASEPLIAGQYAVDFAHPLPGAGGGLPAYRAIDRRGGRTDLMAVQARRLLPPRVDALRNLAGTAIEGVLTPLAYGALATPGGEEGGFLICPAPPGPAVAAQLRPWPEPELLTNALRPAARALDHLAQRRLTHRAIRADNVFRAGPGHPLVLGCAWAGPPAALQPAICEPPYMAMCHPAARGAGAIADDVYALGVLLLTLALGRSPLEGVEDAEVVRQAVDIGSHATLVGDRRLSSFLGDLLRGMLATDPEHRPPPALLLDFTAARSRRIAARPPHRAQRPIQVGDLVCWHARSLAYALIAAPEHGLRALKTGQVDQWVRRGLGDGVLAARLDEHLGFRARMLSEESARSDSLAMMRAVALLDPLAPLCWDGLAVWPDGIGPLLAAISDPAVSNGADIAARIGSLVLAEAQGLWGAMRPDRCDVMMLHLDERVQVAALRQAGQAGGILRLMYQLNPLLPCLGPRLDGRWVLQLSELLPALEAGARRDGGATPPIGPQVAAFIAARGDRRLETEVARLGETADPITPQAQLRLLAQLQARGPNRPVPGLGGWVVGKIDALLMQWNSRRRRETLRPQVRVLAEKGDLVALLVLLDDPQARRADDQEAQQARQEIAWIDAELARLSTEGPMRAARARRLGEEIAAGVGLAALAFLLMTAAFG